MASPDNRKARTIGSYQEALPQPTQEISGFIYFTVIILKTWKVLLLSFILAQGPTRTY